MIYPMSRDQLSRIVDGFGNRVFPDDLLDLVVKEPITISDLLEVHDQVYGKEDEDR